MTWARLDECRMWKLSGRGRRASFTAWTWRDHRSARVAVRRKAGEAIPAMVARGLDELERRLRDGMPPPRPELVARRKLRDAPSASRYSN
jgi:hypothetical protein